MKMIKKPKFETTVGNKTKRLGNYLVLIGSKLMSKTGKTTLEYGKVNPIAFLPFIILISLGISSGRLSGLRENVNIGLLESSFRHFEQCFSTMTNTRSGPTIPWHQLKQIL